MSWEPYSQRTKTQQLYNSTKFFSIDLEFPGIPQKKNAKSTNYSKKGAILCSNIISKHLWTGILLVKEMCICNAKAIHHSNQRRQLTASWCELMKPGTNSASNLESKHQIHLRCLVLSESSSLPTNSSSSRMFCDLLTNKHQLIHLSELYLGGC